MFSTTAVTDGAASNPGPPGAIRLASDAEQRANALVAKMTLDEKRGQRGL
jgi:hypothetical protein